MFDRDLHVFDGWEYLRAYRALHELWHEAQRKGRDSMIVEPTTGEGMTAEQIDEFATLLAGYALRAQPYSTRG